MLIWSTIAIIILAIYATTILTFAIAWRLQKTFVPSEVQPENKLIVSVVVAVRNEEANLSSLIDALAQQELTNNKMETILVDDHSVDNTPRLINQLCNNHSWIKSVKLSDNNKGKKLALKAGASMASGEIICFTDGDCRPGPRWLRTLVDFYLSKDKPDLIIGLVDANPKSVLEHIFRLEFCSLVLSGAGAWSLKIPIFCNGANLAVKASVYKDYTPNKAIVSGDDVFLLHHVKKIRGNIQLIKSGDHLVYTKTASGLKDFINQRRRWASKSIYYTDTATLLIASLIFISNGVLISGLVVSIWYKWYYLIAVLYGLKTVPDLLLFYSSKRLFQLKGLIMLVPIIEVFYPFYIIFTSLSSIKKPFEWKGRNQSI